MMDIISFIILIIFGAIVGWVASIIVGTRGGLLLDIIVGFLGSVIGGWLMDFFGKSGVNGFNLYSFLVALLGSVVLLVIIKAARR